MNPETNPQASPKTTPTAPTVPRGGRLSRESGRFVKFVVVGVLATAVDFIMLNILQATILAPAGPDETTRVLIATTTAYLTGVVFSFTCNRLWIYPDSTPKRLWVQALQFLGVYVFALLVRAFVVSQAYPLWVQFVRDYLMPDAENALAVNRLATNLAQATAIAITLLWNFLANRLWTFGDVE